jgi:hypothetical protein
MFYFNTITKEYPRHVGDLQLLGWQENTELPEGWVEVTDDQTPVITPEQTYEMIEPKLVDNIWIAQFLIRNRTQAEIDRQKALTQELNEKLAGGNYGNN